MIDGKITIHYTYMVYDPSSKLTVVQLIKKFHIFTGLKGSLPCS